MNTRLSNSLGLHLVLLLLAGFWVTTNSVMSSEPTSAEEKSAVAPVVQKVDPFANTTNPTPPPSVYNEPLFKLSHNYSGVPPAPPVNPPWIQALGGKPIGAGNAVAYVNALKNYVAVDMKQLIFNYASWDAGKAGWFNQPWLAGEREAIHGTYIGSTFPPATFPLQTNTMTTYVLTYYSQNAGFTVGRVWGNTALTPNVKEAQFREGAIIVKLAFSSITGDQWPPMAGAATWPIYASTNPNNLIGQDPSLFNVALMQLDIIVKDTKTAPKTGWVFSTLVYDNSLPGDPWDRMVPLGAMWGNDPEVAANPNAPLKESVINPKAPAYSIVTLGWGGRLSGPNDGAVVAPGYVNGVIVTVAASSCMSCHSPAEYPMKSFLLPVPTQNYNQESNPGAIPVIDNGLVLYEPGTLGWMKWFQSRSGSTPADPGTVALDYDMVFAFKSLPNWAAATGKQDKLLLPLFKRTDAFRRGFKYNGLPK